MVNGNFKSAIIPVQPVEVVKAESKSTSTAVVSSFGKVTTSSQRQIISPSIIQAVQQVEKEHVPLTKARIHTVEAVSKDISSLHRPIAEALLQVVRLLKIEWREKQKRGELPEKLAKAKKGKKSKLDHAAYIALHYQDGEGESSPRPRKQKTIKKKKSSLTKALFSLLNM